MHELLKLPLDVIVNVKHSASHHATGQGDCFLCLNQVIVTKSFGHFYGTPLHNLTRASLLWQAQVQQHKMP